MAEPDLQTSFFFARNVAQRLRDIAHERSKQRGIKAICSELAAELATVQQRLEELGDQRSSAIGERRVLKLLDNLERLCQPTVSVPSSSQNDTFDQKRYPSLNRVLAKKEVRRKVIDGFAISPLAHRMKLIKLLKAFGKPQRNSLRGPDLSELLGQEGTQQQRDDYQGYIHALYDILASRCWCQRQDGRKDITANLRLNGCCSPGEVPDSMNFRLFFLDHPHSHDSGVYCQWQDAQICVLRKGVKFNTEKVVTSGPRFGEVLTIDTFCELITNRMHSQLKLVALNEGLVVNGPCPLSQGFLLDASSISLAELLDMAKLSRKMKLLLSYFLAKAVWQFYDSEWMRSGWTKETVHFMFERRSYTPKGIFVNEPFLSAHFDYHHVVQDDAFRTHLFPKILALGIMFLEIELGVNIEKHRITGCLGPNGQPCVNADHIAAIELFNSATLWEEMETFTKFKDVIKACLTPAPFMPYLNDANGLRDAFDKYIVTPLQELYRNAWGDPDTSSIRAIEITTPRQAMNEENHLSLSSLHSPRAVPIYQSPIDGPTTEWPNSGTSTLGLSSDVWFQELDKLNFVLRCKPSEEDTLHTPTRIAILDTGVIEDYVESVKAYKDFISKNDDDWQDNTGHGTNAVRLILKVYNAAEIYVGRVFENSKATRNTAALMVQAIRHAKDIWKVDIIVMPSGFESINREMTRAIDETNNARILVFAAASNYGNLREIAFPGRLYMYNKLICMFSTDTNVRCLPNFNPSASSAAMYSFAVLGENIVLPYVKEPLSGTSFATMIGAALAGRILDFSRQSDNRGRIRSAEVLNTVEGMSAVFAKMAPGGKDNGYDCMAPWKILHHSVDEDPGKRRKDERAHVCETISRALEDIYRT
ncbi:hypothetical protein OIDMADRAFT_170237 [Oidiodendron maius Zn]|uniref:Uncharacterized protein n=1 Tax=Oidiodendron maius (strain Zn) TaxID=913774 RepID=A0A0C3GZB5_OIDMZ|nr:hypothetical protein OIDMADRAFT_170237 [Oidiodendron maius Zn]